MYPAAGITQVSSTGTSKLPAQVKPNSFQFGLLNLLKKQPCAYGVLRVQNWGRWLIHISEKLAWLCQCKTQYLSHRLHQPEIFTELQMMSEFLPSLTNKSEHKNTVYRTESVVCDGYIYAYGIEVAILLFPLGTSSIDSDISMQDVYRLRTKEEKSILKKALHLAYLLNIQDNSKPLKISFIIKILAFGKSMTRLRII